MAITNEPEVWLRGPLVGIPALLQPVAHALLQAREEINVLLKDFHEEKLWAKPAGVASVGFHLKHIAGVLDRLFTYAEGHQLGEEQLNYLSKEGAGTEDVATLVNRLNEQIDLTITKLKEIKEDSLTEFRAVGRKQLPSTKLGLIFHAAEHTMRHLGQLLVTVKVLQNDK